MNNLILTTLPSFLTIIIMIFTFDYKLENSHSSPQEEILMSETTGCYVALADGDTVVSEVCSLRTFADQSACHL